LNTCKIASVIYALFVATFFLILIVTLGNIPWRMYVYCFSCVFLLGY